MALRFALAKLVLVLPVAVRLPHRKQHSVRCRFCGERCEFVRIVSLSAVSFFRRSLRQGTARLCRRSPLRQQVRSSSRMSRNDAAFSRSSTTPSLSGISFAYRFGGGGVNA